MSESRIDPITFEILLHKLWQITEEMGITLAKVSGSAVTVAAKDYMLALWDAGGTTIMTGAGVISHGATAPMGVKHIISTYSDNPGINEGDVFFINDTMISSLHRPDGYVLSPIHYKGERVGWAGTMTHLIDIGSIDPGGFCPSARDIYQEGFNFTGIKFVEKGRLRQDIWDSMLSMVRDPGMVGLDIRAQLAAGEVAKGRVLGIIEEYGLDTYRLLCDEVVKYAETKLKARLRELPDGTWRTVQYWDNDGLTDKVYQLVLAMTKEGDKLTFDFTGTSEQAPTFINCGPPGTKGGIFATMAPLLCYDIPWNEGIMEPVEIIVPDGTFVSARAPAPGSMGSIGGHWMVHVAALDVLSKMLNSSEEFKEDVNAPWHGGVPCASAAGISQYGTFFATLLMDVMGMGGGARSYEDGVDTAGCFFIPEGIMPNVETHELMFPMLYLSRGEVMDSGGPGKFRGGAAVGYTFTLHDAPLGQIILVTYGNSYEGALGFGIAGGYPASTYQLRMLRNSDVLERHSRGEVPTAMEELQGTLELPPPQGLLEMRRGDVYYMESAAGGGYGDPLDRAPEMVRADVVNRIVSPEAAREVYGVVIDPNSGQVDPDKTQETRERIRKDRLSSKTMLQAR